MSIEKSRVTARGDIPEDAANAADRLADLGVSNVGDALVSLGYGNIIHPGAVVKSGLRRAGGRRGCGNVRYRGPSDSELDPHWSQPIRSTSDEIKQRNEKIMELRFRHLVNEFKRLTQDEGESRARAIIRARLEKSNRDRVSRRLPELPFTPEDIFIAATNGAE